MLVGGVTSCLSQDFPLETPVGIVRPALTVNRYTQTRW